MNKTATFDAPLDDPADDLLGMKDYARKLADFIREVPTPFTIGVYGEWGSGKTSFVHFVKYYLDPLENQSRYKPGIKFIEFSAWPHRTSDELWRALILEIARELYEVPKTTEKDETRQNSSDKQDKSHWLVRFLSADALILRKPPSPPDPYAEYKQLVKRLDQTPQSSISADAAQQTQIDQEEAILAIVKFAVAALSSMSPLVAGAKGALNIDTSLDLKNLLHQEKNEAVRERIESVKAFRQILKDLFEEKARDKRVYVFVDDLDRCMPDVALDILEAVKVFLGEVPCVFIVAADENLIGQGLRLRFKNALESEDDEQTRAFFAQKGREYFEKIIQLGVRVPYRTWDQTHEFLAMHDPSWTPATDIIQTVIGENPRRLKQYCGWLKYKRSVAQMKEL